MAPEQKSLNAKMTFTQFRLLKAFLPLNFQHFLNDLQNTALYFHSKCIPWSQICALVLSSVAFMW